MDKPSQDETYDDRRANAELRNCQECGTPTYFVTLDTHCRNCRLDSLPPLVGGSVTVTIPRCALCGRRVPESMKSIVSEPRKFCSGRCASTFSSRKLKGITAPYKPRRR